MHAFKSILHKTLLLLSLQFMAIPAYAEVTPLYGAEEFEDSLSYPSYVGAAGYRIHDIDAAEADSRNGIIFTGEGESGVRIHKGEDYYLGFGSGMQLGKRCIEHVPSETSSADEGLVIRFKYPVKKFGVFLGSISPSSEDHPLAGFDIASLRAYSSNGQFIGTVEMEVIANPPNYDGYSFFGFETDNNQGVTTVVLDYGDAEKPERIATIFYEYNTPRPFRVILPHIAHGTISGASIDSDLSLFWDRLANVKLYSTLGEIPSNPYLGEGNNFQLQYDEMTGGVYKGFPTQFHFKSSTIPGINDLTVGYVVAESDYPIDGQVVYRTTDSDGKVYEADIRGCVPETYLQIPFELNQSENLNAALAIVNPSDTVAEIEIHVNDSEGSYTEFWEPPTFTLQPGEQKALFMHELWDEMPSEDGSYILQLRSAVPFAAAAFYTRNWIVVGNLPVWSYKEGQAR
jgi:hypothetical protein